MNLVKPAILESHKNLVIKIAIIVGIVCVIVGGLAFLWVKEICVYQGREFPCFNPEDYLLSVRIYPYRSYSYLIVPFGLIMTLGGIVLRRSFKRNVSKHTNTSNH